LVLWTPPKKDRPYYQAVVNCAENGGREAFYHDMLQRDLSKFDPYAPPPMTVAKTDLIDLGRPNPERFYLAWREGDIPVPFHTCSAGQAYRLYKRWAQIQGEKFISANNYFSRQVLREAKESITLKVTKTGPPSTKTARMWLVTPPPDGVDMGTFIAGAIESFESHLVRYTGEEK
jgi:putative DNA primase/helicase